MRFAIATLGCKVNQHESQQMREQLLHSGMQEANNTETADVYIINSCTVTATADQKTRQLVRRARRQHPDAVICLTGCVPQVWTEQAEKLTEADVVLGNSNREKLVDCIMLFLQTHQRVICVEPHTEKSGLLGGVADFAERTRACIKIEDGCNRFCAYCIIPYARGRVRSRALADIRKEAELVSKRCAEVVLVGINLSAYGQDIGLTLADAVREVASVEGVKRIRLGSLEPDLLTPELLDYLAAEPKFCPQFHMSVQSGCDTVLERMGRKYTTEQYFALVKDIRKRFAAPSVTTDIMVGFPGETDEEFETTLRFVESVEFARAHCFVYSRRPGTPAAQMSCQVASDVASCRSARLIAATEQCASRFMEAQIGKRAKVLLERTEAKGRFEGYSENYTPICIECGDAERESLYAGQIVEVLITGMEEQGCIGKII